MRLRSIQELLTEISHSATAAVVNTDLKKVENVRDAQRGHIPQTQQVPREEVAGMTVRECLGSSPGLTIDSELFATAEMRATERVIFQTQL